MRRLPYILSCCLLLFSCEQQVREAPKPLPWGGYKGYVQLADGQKLFCEASFSSTQGVFRMFTEDSVTVNGVLYQYQGTTYRAFSCLLIGDKQLTLSQGGAVSPLKISITFDYNIGIYYDDMRNEENCDLRQLIPWVYEIKGDSLVSAWDEGPNQMSIKLVRGIIWDDIDLEKWR